MKKRSFFAIGLFLALFVSVSRAEAQLVMSLTFNRMRYMLHEHIYACVTIRNDSGRPLLFGEKPELQGYVLFDIRDDSGRLIKKRGSNQISVTGLYIAPGEIKRMVIPLHKYYDLSKEGFYHIHAYAAHNQVPAEYRSKDVTIRIHGGETVWKKVVGLPDSSVEGNARLMERTYSIKQFNGDGGIIYYMIVEDAGKIIAVTRVGHLVAHMKFSAQVDMLSRIHLLMPVAPRIYHYMSFNASGMNLESSYWKTSGTVPMLYRDSKTGKVIRLGGVVARKGIDYADPKGAYMTISDLTDGPKTEIIGKEDSGLVDLGADSMPVKSADED